MLQHFEQYMVYKNGYHKDHPVIRMFWTVFNDLPVEAKRKFLGIYVYILVCNV